MTEPTKSAPTPPDTYRNALDDLIAAWNRLRACPDAPSDRKVALDGLRLVLPLAAEHKLVHNYRYREATAVAQHAERSANARRSVHGPDGSTAVPIEIKTAGLSSKTVTPSQTAGMFDKIHTRTDPGAVLSAGELQDLRDAVAGAGDQTVVRHGVTINSPRRRALLAKIAPEAGTTDTHWPALVSWERMTSSAQVRLVDFCLFVEGGVDPLLTIETTTQALEQHLGALFDAGLARYHSGMSARSGRAPSARDSVTLNLGHLMAMPEGAVLVHLDTAQLQRHGLDLDPVVVAWAQSGAHATDEIKAQIARWEAGKQRVGGEAARTRRGP